MFLHMVLNISTTVRKITNGDQSCENWKIKKLEDDINKKKEIHGFNLQIKIWKKKRVYNHGEKGSSFPSISVNDFPKPKQREGT